MAGQPEAKGSTSAPSSPKTSSDRPRSKSYSGNGGHRKTPSGNILSRIPFFRTSSDTSQAQQPLVSAGPDDVVPFPEVPEPEEDATEMRSPALASFMETQTKSRKRKGSLRKTALLGTGRLRLDKTFSVSDNVKSRSPNKLFFGGSRSPRKQSRAGPDAPEDDADLAINTSLEIPSEPQALRLQTSSVASNNLRSPVMSPTGPYGSTTDDDDRFTIPSTVGSLSVPFSKPSPSPSPPSSEASLPTTKSARRLSNKPISASPLATPSPLDPNEEWDYSATEWWGWIILIVTWVVFVVGMGSCFGVWSWAWDVGETPDAPPDLEDDPTLPIIGYYPALMVLTAFVSWIWVVVAWMGMKYFKHAKIQSEDD